jgi:SpoVK/Ycf46/Vps4 family AAA+-type ATPase
VIVGSERRLASKRYLPAAVPPPGTREQRSLWNDALTTAGIPPRPVTDALAQQFHFGPAAILGAVGAARARAALRGSGPEGVGDSDLWDAGRDQAAWSLDDLAQRLTPTAHWDDIVLPEDVLAQLREIAAQVANRAQVYDRWGFSRQLGRGRGITALFGGPSGTGKTMAAEILASELELDLYRVDLAGLMDKYVGETEKNLRAVFDAAERSGSILFFDEADALFGKRTEVKDSHDRYANIEVNYLLQRMEDYRGLAILATNRKAVLDRAFLRRLRFLVDFSFPDATSRRRIWEKVFPHDAELGKLDLAGLARLELSGGHIKTIAVNAAFLAAAEHVPIAMPHVMHAARREYAKLDRSTSKTEFGRYHQAAR